MKKKNKYTSINILVWIIATAFINTIYLIGRPGSPETYFKSIWEGLFYMTSIATLISLGIAAIILISNIDELTDETEKE